MKRSRGARTETMRARAQLSGAQTHPPSLSPSAVWRRPADRRHARPHRVHHQAGQTVGRAGEGGWRGDVNHDAGRRKRAPHRRCPVTPRPLPRRGRGAAKVLVQSASPDADRAGARMNGVVCVFVCYLSTFLSPLLLPAFPLFQSRRALLLPPPPPPARRLHAPTPGSDRSARACERAAAATYPSSVSEAGADAKAVSRSMGASADAGAKSARAAVIAAPRPDRRWAAAVAASPDSRHVTGSAAAANAATSTRARGSAAADGPRARAAATRSSRHVTHPSPSSSTSHTASPHQVGGGVHPAVVAKAAREAGVMAATASVPRRADDDGAPPRAGAGDPAGAASRSKARRRWVVSSRWA